MTPQEKLDYLKKDIEKEIMFFFDLKENECKKINLSILRLCQEMRTFTQRGGKRLRAILMVLGNEAYSKKKNTNIIKLSVVWELIQSFLLIHDDIIDQDILRRGGDTLHIALSKEFKNDHLGMSQAILSGDIMYIWSLEHVLKYAGSKSSQLLEIINREIKNVVYGEMLDVAPWTRSENFENRINLIHDLKTSRYTTLGPYLSGAILAGIDNDEIEIIREFTSHLGLAFQIQDDYLGVFGATKRTGKSILSDLRDGKLTHLVAHALKNSSKLEGDFIYKVLGNLEVKMEDFEKFKSILIKLGSDKHSLGLVSMHSEIAKELLQKTNASSEIKKCIEFLTMNLINRDN